MANRKQKTSAEKRGVFVHSWQDLGIILIIIFLLAGVLTFMAT